MHTNSVRVLRAQQLTSSTREFKARGAALKRCSDCLLAESECICHSVSPVATEIGVCMLMYHAEYYKPSNTGQLITELVPNNFAFRWERTTVDPNLTALLEDERWFPIIVFPHDNVEQELCIDSVPDEIERQGKQPLFIFLDGTWRQAKKMYIKSPYLAKLPVLEISDVSKGAYQLRESYHDHHLSTAEVAVEVFRQNHQAELAEALEQLFLRFRTSYKMFKR